MPVSFGSVKTLFQARFGNSSPMLEYKRLLRLLACRSTFPERVISRCSSPTNGSRMSFFIEFSLFGCLFPEISHHLGESFLQIVFAESA